MPACHCLRQDCGECARRSDDERRREVLSETRFKLLDTWRSALDLRLFEVDQQLPQPLLFGRRRWRRIRDGARHLLDKEYAVGWVALLNARTLDEMYAELEIRAQGPDEAARVAIDCARSTLA